MASATTAPGNIAIGDARARSRGLLRPILMLGGIAIVVVGAGVWWLEGGRYVSIDDSYVRAAKLAITDDISGIIDVVDVHEGQHVNKGDKLFSLRDRQVRIALEGAKANMAQTALNIESMKRDYQRMLRDVEVRETMLQSDQANYDRYANLVKGGGVTRAEYDDARFKLAGDKASLDSLKEQAQVQLAKLSGDPNVDPTTTPQYRQVKSQADEYQRQLDHTIVYAPFSGTVTNVEATQPGMYLTVGMAAFGLVSDEHVWVEANPKETELTHVKPGDPVEVTVDTYPGQIWHGHVDSIAPASASEFSVLPAQNSSGNWVKVVQRLPVRISVDRKPGEPELRAGMSVEADIDTGHERHLSDLIPVSQTTAASANAARIPPAPVPAFHVVPHRALITVCAMVATLMQALDSTIANVALPYMQGSLSATSDQITWVLTSYIVAAAIMTAPVGWMSARFGRKNLFVACLVGFTAASMLCGVAQSLPQMVLFRLLQGVFGAALVPLSQAVMLDIYPPAQRGSAMAIWGVGVMVGPILGPTLGGYLTDVYNWRWVFFVNLPFGILAIGGMALFMPKAPRNQSLKFDWTGFAVLALGIGAFQMMLDRGQDKDWFGSGEIITEAVLAGLGIYLFLVHLMTAQKPFISPRIFKDINFSASLVMMFAVGVVLLATSALLAPWLQNLGNYPVATAGLVMAPRGIGTMAAMMISGRLASRVDPRILMGLGVLMMVWSLYAATGWTPDVSAHVLILTLIVQGAALGFVFIPLQVVAFATLPTQYRTDGTSLLSLLRNVGSAIGVSVTSAMLAHNVQVLHSELGGYITPFNRALQVGGAVSRYFDPGTPGGAQVLDAVVNNQASIIAYNDDYKLMMLVTLPTLILLFIMRRPGAQPKAAADGHAAVLD